MAATKCLGKTPNDDCYEVWRQDDNGNKFFITAYSTHDEAQKRAEELTARGHKQTYWVEPCKHHKRVGIRTS